MKYVAYYRVSTDKQARRGLGLEAQTATVESFVAREAGAAILAVFQEAQTGKRNDQPELEAALSAEAGDAEYGFHRQSDGEPGALCRVRYARS